MKKPVELITFDLDNTLWPVDDVMIKAESALQAWIKANHPDISHRFSRQGIVKIRQEIVKDKPDLSHNLTALRILTLKELFLQSGFDEHQASLLAEEGFEVFYKMRNTINFFPGALELLDALAEKHILIGLSNGNADLSKIGIDHYFTHHHSAESIGKPKPHPAMFRTALKSASKHLPKPISPDQAYHLGDHPEQDIEAARQCGMNTIWVNVLNLQWPSEIEPTIEVNHLLKIIDIINNH